MSYLTFQPTIEEDNLISNALRSDPNLTLESTLPIDVLEDTDTTLQHLFESGYKYIVSFEDKPSFSQLRYSNWAEEISHKVAIPYSLSIFRLGKIPQIKQTSSAILVRHNPEEFKITENDLQPDTNWFENFRFRYTRWEEAWWREALQNSVDACLEALDKYNRRGKIECNLYFHEGKPDVFVEVNDNGIGMDRNTLVRAFLTPGGSGKRDIQTGRPPTGGLGKAKEMLFHAWPWWSVWTQKDGSEGFYVEAKYGPYISGNLLMSEKRSRPELGTTVRVLMKQDTCVKKEHLVNFISLSEFPIKVIFRKYLITPDGKTHLQEEEHLKAENKITIKEPNRILTRTDNSPWAHIYHMPKARNHKQVIIRANGLYLFSSDMSIDISGKVIIELEYKPKGMRWSQAKWIPMDPVDISKQSIEDYGPLELLTESRDGLLDTYRGSRLYKTYLNQFLNELVKKPEIALKPKRLKHRVRVVNRTKNKQKQFQEILEKVDPLKILEEPNKTLEEYEKARPSPELILEDIARKLIKGELSLSDPNLFNKLKEIYTPQQLLLIKNVDAEHLKMHIERLTGRKTAEIEIQRVPEQEIQQEQGPKYPSESKSDIEHLPRPDAKKIEFFSPNLCKECAKKQAGSARRYKNRRNNPEIYQCKVCGATAIPITKSDILPSAAEHVLSEVSPIEYQNLKSVIEQIQPTAVDTSVSQELYQIYKEILPSIIKEKQDENMGRNYGEVLLKILEWEPDFILSDETEDPTPRPPEKFNPQFFTAKEKQIAKFWIEATRLCMILTGIFVPNLEVGFLFENPGSDAFRGEFIVDSGSSELVAEQIGSFKAVLLAPCDLKDNRWGHRYAIRDYNSASTIVSIAFHEIVHANLNLNEEHQDAAHNNIFASLLTDYLQLAMRHASSFFKLAKFCSDIYPIKGARAEGEVQILIEEGRGFYQVRCSQVRGKPPSFATWKEVMHYLSIHVSEGKDCKVTLWYWPQGKTKNEVREIAQFNIWDLKDLDVKFKRALTNWRQTTQFYNIPFPELSDEEIWRSMH